MKGTGVRRGAQGHSGSQATPPARGKPVLFWSASPYIQTTPDHLTRCFSCIRHANRTDLFPNGGPARSFAQLFSRPPVRTIARQHMAGPTVPLLLSPMRRVRRKQAERDTRCSASLLGLVGSACAMASRGSSGEAGWFSLQGRQQGMDLRTKRARRR